MAQIHSLAEIAGWPNSSKLTVERGIRNEGNKYDPVTTIGLKGHEAVLVIGNAVFHPYLKEHNDELVVSAPKPRDTERLLREDVKFSKVVIGREVPFSNDNILRAAALMAPGESLLAFFPQDEGVEWQFKNSLEFYYPLARVWESETTFGKVIMAEFAGTSYRFTV